MLHWLILSWIKVWNWYQFWNSIEAWTNCNNSYNVLLLAVCSISNVSCYEWIKIRWHPISFVCLYFKINEFGKFFYKLKIISFYSPLSYWRLCVVNFFYLHCFYLFKQSAHFKYTGKAQCCRQSHGNNEKNTRLSVKLLDDLRTWVPRRMVCDIIEHLSR